MRQLIYITLFIYSISLSHGLIKILESNQTFPSVPCNASVFNGIPIYDFGSVTGKLVYQNATALEKSGSIILVQHIDPADENIEKAVGSATGVLGIITISLEEIPGKSFLETTFKKIVPYPWVEIAKTNGTNLLLPLALTGNYTVLITANETNRWKQFVDTPVVFICQVIVFGGNIAICILVAYLSLMIAQLKKNPIHLLNIISEFLGAFSRLIFFVDPMGAYRVVNTSVSSGFLVFMFPFGLINCLLLSLYFQESMRLKDIKVFNYVKQTQWLFYTVCVVLVVLLVFVPILKLTGFYDTYRLIVVIIIASIGAIIAIFYIISGVQIINTLKQNFSDQTASKRKQLSIRIVVTASCILLMCLMLFITRATFLRSPAGYLIGLTIAASAGSAVGIFSLVSLIVINTRGASTSSKDTKKTQQSKTMEKTQGNTTRSGEGKKEGDESSGDVDSKKEGDDSSGEELESKKEDKVTGVGSSDDS